MVAVFTGAGAGLMRGSASVLGNSGLIGSALQGRFGDNVLVNAANGNLVVTRQDEILTGRGPDTDVTRTYNSLSQATDDNGDHWNFGAQRRLQNWTGTPGTAGSKVDKVEADGSVVTYTYDTAIGAYVSTAGAGSYDRIVYNSGWVWTDGDTRVFETYDTAGKLITVTDTSGNSVTFTYDAQSKLSRTTTQNGEYKEYVWSGNNIIKVTTGYTEILSNTAKTETVSQYIYDANNRLQTVTLDMTPADHTTGEWDTGHVLTYGYDAAGRLSSINQNDGQKVDIVYDSMGRVSTFTETENASTTYVTSFSYGTNFTQVTDPNGNVTRLDYNSAGHLTKVTAPPASTGATAQITQFTYNANGDVLSVVDALGKSVSFEYDTRGNQTKATDQLGNVITRTYDAANQLIMETSVGSWAGGDNETQTTRYAYDAQSRLRYVVSRDGRVTEYRYLATGEVTRAITYTGATYTLGTAAISVAMMDSWQTGLSDKQNNENVDYIYDARGNQIERRGYSNWQASGYATSTGWSRDYTNYDHAGRLIRRYSPSEKVTSFTYDGMGRVLTAVDINAGTTTFTYGGFAASVISASKAYTNNHYKYSGPVSLVWSYESVGGTFVGLSKVFSDRLGRERVAQDNLGNKSYSIYDAAGRLTGTVDHIGRLTEYRYDANNRLVATAQYQTAISASHLATLDNALNTLTLADIRPAANAGDIWSWSFYDAKGQLSAQVDGAGSVTGYQYDRDGRLILSRSYANKLTATQIAAFKLSVPTVLTPPAEDAVKDSVARSFYTRDGLLAAALNAEGYLTVYTRDGAGRIEREASYANATGTAAAVNRTIATLNALIASITADATQDRVLNHSYDGQGFKRYTIDGSGYVTEYLYDSDNAQATSGIVRGTIQHAVAISFTNAKYTIVKAQVEALASNAANADRRSSFAVYDSSNRVAYSVDADGGVRAFTYNVSGLVTKTVEFATKLSVTALPTLAAMDTWRNSNLANTANRITRTWYNNLDQARFSADAEGYVTEYAYDSEGRTLSTTRYATAANFTDTSTLANVTSAVAADKTAGRFQRQQVTYDNAGRLSTETDAEGIVTSYVYNGVGQLISRYDAYGTADQARTVYSYDATGRIASVTTAYGEPEASTIQYGYDGLGNQTSVTDARGKVTTYAYNRLGQVVSTTNALSGITSYQYNAFGQVSKITDPLGKSSSQVYDRNGRLTRITDAIGMNTDTTYNQFGDVVSVQRGATITNYQYDKLGRTVRITDALGFFERFTYNAFGQIETKTAKSSSSDSSATGGVTTYTYDRRGLMLSETLPMASVDTAGNVVASTVTNRYEYDSRGNKTKSIEAYGLAEARTTSFEYDKNDRLTKSIGQLFFEMVPETSYKYDARGNVTSIVDPAGARTIYYYDDLGRKRVEINAVGTYTRYTYDAGSNLLETRVYGTAVTVPTDGGSEEEAPAVPAGGSRATTFTYDDLGRQTRSAVAGVTSGYLSGSMWVTSTADIQTLYQYDAAGNLVKKTDPNGNTTWAYYDALGRKTHEVDGEGYLTKWAYDVNGNVLQEHRYAIRAATPTGIVTAPAVAANSADRITNFTYDSVGNRLSESRLNVQAHDGNGGTTSTSSSIRYSYNGLGQVVRKLEATDNASISTDDLSNSTRYSYDATGRMIQEDRAQFVDMDGNVVTPSVVYSYNGLNNLTRTIQLGRSSQENRATLYFYDGDKLRKITDSSGNIHFLLV